MSAAAANHTSANTSSAPEELYGVLAEYRDSESLLWAAHRVHEAGYSATDAFAPYPVEGLAEAIGQRRTGMAWFFLAGGLVGGAAAYGLQYWVSVIAYPLNIGGRPLHSWPSFIPATFETTVLFSSLAGFLGLLAACGLPRLHHPLFEVTRFQQASTDAYFLCIEARDRRFDRETTREFLFSCGATEVWDVPQTR